MSAKSSIQENHKREISPPRSRKRKRLEEPRARPQQKSLIVYSWNVNGIAPFLQPSVASYFKTASSDGDNEQSMAKASLRDFLRRHDWPTVLCLQEVKINQDDAATIRAVEKAVRRQANEPDDAHDYEAHFCLPSDDHNARGFGRKVYGVCSIIRSDFRKRFVQTIRPVSWDVEGRFLIIETRGEADVGIPELAIINIYAVNGTDNPYKDPNTGEIIGTRHDRKLRTHELLQAEIRQLEGRGFAVLAAGDLNVARTALDGHPNLRIFPKQHCLNRADFEARFLAESTDAAPTSVGTSSGRGRTATATEMPALPSTTDSRSVEVVDTFRHLHPTQRGYTYYPRNKPFGASCDRVDMILVSRTLQNNLKRAGMHETVQERGTSDHVPLFAELEFEQDPDNRGGDGETVPSTARKLV